METLWQDIKYGARMLVKNPGITLVIVLTLGLGIGANTAIFSIVNAFLFRPLPVEDPHQLVMLATIHPPNKNPHRSSYLDYLDYRQQSDAFSDLAAYNLDLVGLTYKNQAERIAVIWVTENYFPMLGISAAAGRLTFPPGSDKPGGEQLVILGHAFWNRRFAGDPSIIGDTVQINGRPFTVIGIVPKTFRGTYAIAELDAYLPLGQVETVENPESFLVNRNDHDTIVLGRLKPDVTLEEAQASLDVIATRLQNQYPDTNKDTVMQAYPETLSRPEPAGEDEVGLPAVSAVFMTLVGLVLLVACVNVANILLVRATMRQKELAIRAALGAGRMRLIRQLLTESLLLALLGGVAGLGFGLLGSTALSSIRVGFDLPINFHFEMDWRVFSYTMAAAMVAGIIFGILPALRASNQRLNDTLREGGRALGGGTGRHWARNTLVVAQVAISLVLLVAAGLFIRSLEEAQTMDLGFEPKNLLNFGMDPGQLGHDQARAEEFYRELGRRVRSLPGVESATLAFNFPMSYYGGGSNLYIEGQLPEPGTPPPGISYNLVDEYYFDTLRIPLVMGRGVTAEDTATSRPVAIINQTMAERFWPGEIPLGRRFSLEGPEGPYIEIVGVAKNGKYRDLMEDPRSYLYLPLTQKYASTHVLQVRTLGPPAGLTPAIRREIQQLAPTLPLYDVQTMEKSLKAINGYFFFRIGAMLAATLGLLGLVLASVGIYGVVSYSAHLRTHEIGIRMALGAQTGNIFRLVVGQGMVLTLIGLGLGLGLAAALSQVLANLLYGVSTLDPITFTSVLALLLVVAFVAAFIPARRATKVDPMVALRYE